MRDSFEKPSRSLVNVKVCFAKQLEYYQSPLCFTEIPFSREL